MAVKENTQIRLIKRPSGEIKDSDFSIETESIDTSENSLNSGDILVEHLMTGLDPGMRGWMDEMYDSYAPPVELGAVMSAASCVSRVISSRNDGFNAGDLVWTFGSWQNFQLLPTELAAMCMKLPTQPRVPYSTYLSALGYTGLTAYSGMIAVGKPQAGETILISGAAGAVGSIAGQLAKLKAGNCRVVGIAGSKEKCEWLINTAGFDSAINYKEVVDMQAAMKQHCPDGVDLFFDNIGGKILDAALMNINSNARIVMCGTISSYNDDVGNRAGPANMWQLLVKNARIEGFTVSHPDHVARWQEYRDEIEQAIVEDKLHYRDQIVKDIENTLDAFRSLFQSGNSGRLIMQFSEDI